MLSDAESAISMNGELHDLRREAVIQSMMDHPTIVKIEALSVVPLALILEYCPYGTLYDRLHMWNTPLPWAWRLHVALNLASALSYLHTRYEFACEES